MVGVSEDTDRQINQSTLSCTKVVVKLLGENFFGRHMYTYMTLCVCVCAHAAPSPLIYSHMETVWQIQG